MRAIRVIVRNFRNAFKSIFRNVSLSMASIICTSITLILVSIAIIFSVTINNFTKDLENELTIVAFLERGTTDEQEQEAKNQILEIENVDQENVILKNKEEVRKEMMEENESFRTVMEKWDKDSNPLQSEIIVSVKNVRKIKETTEQIEKLELIKSAQCGENIVDKYLIAFDGIKKATIVIIGALIVISVFLICNTIKLTIFSRKNEIDIMRLVGTSNTVIKLPFVIEGLFLGIFGSILPIGISIYAYFLLYEKYGYLIPSIIKLTKPFPFIIYDSLLT